MSSKDPSTAGPVLVAVDFSPHSEAALLWAARAARSFEVSLVVLHVVHDPGAAPGSYARTTEGQPRSMENVAAEMMEEFLAGVRGRNPSLGDLRTAIAVGLPPTRIVEVAEREGAQLVVVGSQGRTRLGRFLLGSKAERVAQLSPVPVTIVKTADPE